MAKKYTAQEMRKMAYEMGCEYGDHPEACEMLIWAADMMEREKKYEYSELYSNENQISSIHEDSEEEVRRFARRRKCTVVRRSVGEWEEVKA